MNEPDELAALQFQLPLVLSLFSRVDTVAAVVLGINLGMLGFLATNVPALENLHCSMLWLSLIFIACLMFSFWQLYVCAFPQLAGGKESLIFFRSVARLREEAFAQAVSNRSREAFVRDLAGQVWRNSEILSLKYGSLKRAILGMSLAIPFWVITLVLFVMENARTRELLLP